MRIFTLAALALAALATTFAPSAPSQPADSPGAESPPRRAVLITGASTGIGRATAELLAANGFHVFAGARKPADIAALSALPNIDGIRLDVTIPADIAAAVETVRTSGHALFGLINNAGVVVVGPMTELTDADYNFQMDVNVAGPLRITRAFAPMIIESKGRIITTGSISGVATWPMGGAYTMSKHAVEAYSDTLAMELEPFGVQVSLVEPGNFQSKIMQSMAERLKSGGYSSDGSRYKERMDRMLGGNLDRSQHKHPKEAAPVFLAALTDEKPKARYMIVPNQGEAISTIRASMRRLVERNLDHEFSLTREELIKMLDAELARADR